MLTQRVKLQLAAGYLRPSNYEEIAWREKFRKPNAVPGSGFPGLTPEEYAMCVPWEESEVVGVESAPHQKFRVILACGHSELHDTSVDDIAVFFPDGDGKNATTTCFSCHPEVTDESEE